MIFKKRVKNCFELFVGIVFFQRGTVRARHGPWQGKRQQQHRAGEVSLRQGVGRQWHCLDWGGRGPTVQPQHAFSYGLYEQQPWQQSLSLTSHVIAPAIFAQPQRR
jgi:hypothetical protein